MDRGTAQKLRALRRKKDSEFEGKETIPYNNNNKHILISDHQTFYARGRENETQTDSAWRRQTDR